MTMKRKHHIPQSDDPLFDPTNGRLARALLTIFLTSLAIFIVFIFAS
jgi:hypothetical protein